MFNDDTNLKQDHGFNEILNKKKRNELIDAN